MIFTINHHPHPEPVATFGWLENSMLGVPRSRSGSKRPDGYIAARTMMLENPRWRRLPASIVIETLVEKTRASVRAATEAYHEALSLLGAA